MNKAQTKEIITNEKIPSNNVSATKTLNIVVYNNNINQLGTHLNI